MENEEILTVTITREDWSDMLSYEEEDLFSKLPTDLKESVIKSIKRELSEEVAPAFREEILESILSSAATTLEDKDLFDCIIGEKVLYKDVIAPILAYSRIEATLMVEYDGKTETVYFDDVEFERSVKELDSDFITQLMAHDSADLLTALLRKKTIIKIASQGAPMDQEKILAAAGLVANSRLGSLDALVNTVISELEEKQHVG